MTAHNHPLDMNDLERRSDRHALSDLDEYRLVDEDQDIRGWKLMDRAGNELGKIDELIVDTAAERVDTVRLESGVEYSVRDLTIGDDIVYLDTVETGALGVPAAVMATVGKDGEVILLVIEERLRIGKRTVDAGGVPVSTT